LLFEKIKKIYKNKGIDRYTFGDFIEKKNVVRL
jgi:hypothetical protein